MPDAATIVYFDGVCNLCNGLVRFFLKHDKSKRILFASLQSKAGRRAVDEASPYSECADTVLLYHRKRYYVRSAAAIRAVVLLGGFWRLAAILLVIPPFIRDLVYRWVATKRYVWFGKRTECMVPGPELRMRFLQD